MEMKKCNNKKDTRDWTEEFVGKNKILTTEEMLALMEKYKERYGEYPETITSKTLL